MERGVCNKDKALVGLGCVIDLGVGSVQDGQCDPPVRFSLR